ncbi:MAG: heterodisulfide reductase, partial [Deltaproteobacteria bacterium]|nr:heterodisulfide reductase [Deltaproteobacteria bacterium]
IWVCTSCEACVARCPNEIDIPHLMDTLHQIAAQEGFVSSEPAVPAFHAAFLMPIKMFGRQFEALMTGVFMLRKGSFSLSDMISNGRLGLKLFMRGKLKLKPHVIRGTGQMADIFRKTRKER